MSAQGEPTPHEHIGNAGASPVAGRPRLDAFPGTGATTGCFEVSPDELDAVKADLDEALEELRRASDTAQYFRTILPPGNDEVSVSTTNEIIKHLTVGSGSAVGVVDEMRRWVGDLRGKVEAAQREYRRIDEANQIGES
ncbi:hypothetical protein GCM10011581_27890 [Saccharopolyspora subtropica]|uniref:PE domain-containing protein n=1 Tax=Saccharopolyspora thermophila TaxID=89367 RepID=A0A917JXL3_9PSEU|nr:PE domain-containing protein [Saccharopolyspora subtropica]GGI89226.1 hypothetical protein GCM10011581_27890 [Saccharopolyspora subtropica]